MGGKSIYIRQIALLQIMAQVKYVTELGINIWILHFHFYSYGM